MKPSRYDPQPRKWPRQARSRATFDALLDATARILERDGYAALTTNRIAERAGASVGTLYEYFPDADTMVALLAAREIGRVLDVLESSMEALHDEPFEPAMRAWLGVGRERFYDDPAIAIMPMGFCYPGKGRSGDLPPRPECAPSTRAARS